LVSRRTSPLPSMRPPAGFFLLWPAWAMVEGGSGAGGRGGRVGEEGNKEGKRLEEGA
jgi:hypothetical protein